MEGGSVLHPDEMRDAGVAHRVTQCRIYDARDEVDQRGTSDSVGSAAATSRLESALIRSLAWSAPSIMYTAGTIKSVNNVPIDSPVNSTIPIARRPAAPAPDARTNGRTPNTMAAVVIRI